MAAAAPRKQLREAFGELIRELRIDAGLTQEQLSFRARVHRTYIGNLERGEKSPTLDVIVALATALGAEPSDLVAVATRHSGKAGAAKRSEARPRQRVRSYAPKAP